MLQSSTDTIETRASWTTATVALGILAIAFGAPWCVAVALKTIAAEAGGERSVPALAISLAWIGSGLGGIAMGRIAETIGVRSTVIFGAIMIALGTTLATFGPGWQLYVGYGLFVGLIGLGGINAPLYVYVSRWFDRRRGSALALISSGVYLAGALWPPIFERAIASMGWRQSLMWFGAFAAVAIVPLATIYLKPAPELPDAATVAHDSASTNGVLGWPPNLVFALLAAGIFLCCVPMSMPQGHLVAFCSDIGISASHGAAMLSVLLGTGFLTRQLWGLIADRIGGLRTVLIGSSWQAITIAGFLTTQNEIGLFAIAAAFGIGYSGLVPANALAVRELFPAAQAHWRIPTLLFCNASGMATGGWLAGALYDHFGYYGPAFATAVAVNILNLAVITTLIWRQTSVIAQAR
jgi:MFS family permease